MNLLDAAYDYMKSVAEPLTAEQIVGRIHRKRGTRGVLGDNLIQ